MTTSTITVDRDCGDCVVCCVYPRMKSDRRDPRSFDKKGMRHCPELTLPAEPEQHQVFYTGASKTNCRIYAERPTMCSAYSCAWVQGYGGDGDRPDKVLMLFDNANQIENSVEAKPLTEGQESTEEGRAVIARMSRSTGLPVLVLGFTETRLQRVEGRGV